MYLRADTLFSLNLLIGVALPEVFSIVGHSLARLFICGTLKSERYLVSRYSLESIKCSYCAVRGEECSRCFVERYFQVAAEIPSCCDFA